MRGGGRRKEKERFYFFRLSVGNRHFLSAKAFASLKYYCVHPQS